MYAESKMAKNVKYGRSKSEVIVRELLEKEILKDVVQNLKKIIIFVSTD